MAIAGRMLHDFISVEFNAAGVAGAMRNCQAALFITIGSLNMEPINNS